MMFLDRMARTYELLEAPRVRADLRDELEAAGFAGDALDEAACDVITRAFVALEETGARLEDEELMCSFVRETVRQLLEERAGTEPSEKPDIDLLVVESSRSPMLAALPIVE